VYIYYHSYEAREQVGKRSRQARSRRIIQRISRIIQRISRWRRERKRRRGNFADGPGRLIGTAEPVNSLSFSF
jgi:hypothetical protein